METTQAVVLESMITHRIGKRLLNQLLAIKTGVRTNHRDYWFP